MKKLIFSIIFTTFCILSQSQVLGISMGTHLIPDKVLFEKPASNSPRPFVFIGLTYTTKEITMGISYTMDLHIITISSQIPLWNVNKRKYKSFALLNNNKL